MRVAPALLLLAAVAPLAAADLGSIDREFERRMKVAREEVLAQKLEALEAYAGDPANAKAADLVPAMFAAADLAAMLEKHAAAREWATRVLADDGDGAFGARARFLAGNATLRLGGESAKAKELLLGAIDRAELTNESVQTTFDAAEALASHLLDSGDRDGALQAWEAVRAKLPDPRIEEFIQGRVRVIQSIGKEPPALAAKDLEGKQVTLEQLRGKVVLLDFWASWCAPCVEELPNVVAVHEEFKDRGFEVLGVSLDRERERLDGFLKEHPMPWRQVFDLGGALAQLYEVDSIPSTWLIGRDGKIARRNLRGEALRAAVARLVATK